jgi:hypothetical protein
VSLNAKFVKAFGMFRATRFELYVYETAKPIHAHEGKEIYAIASIRKMPALSRLESETK